MTQLVQVLRRRNFGDNWNECISATVCAGTAYWHLFNAVGKFGEINLRHVASSKQSAYLYSTLS